MYGRRLESIIDYKGFCLTHPVIYVYKPLSTGEILKDEISDYSISEYNNKCGSFSIQFESALFSERKNIYCERINRFDGNQNCFITTMSNEEEVLKKIYRKIKQWKKNAEAEARRVNAKVEKYTNIAKALNERGII